MIGLALTLLAFFLLLRVEARVPDPDFDALCLGAMVDALAECHISHKEAYLSMGLAQGHWSEICAGTKAMPSTARLMRLPSRFWFCYWPRIIYVVGRKQAVEVRADFSIKRSA